jgi:isoquinoline 1-oxidoreductase alpha subunit
MPYTLKINGQSKTVDVPAEMPLLWVLRDVLNMKGTKFGCGIGSCGACTVQIAGRAVRACQTPVSKVGNDEVKTIEGLSPDGSHPLQNLCRCGTYVRIREAIHLAANGGRKA